MLRWPETCHWHVVTSCAHAKTNTYNRQRLVECMIRCSAVCVAAPEGGGGGERRLICLLLEDGLDQREVMPLLTQGAMHHVKRVQSLCCCRWKGHMHTRYTAYT